MNYSALIPLRGGSKSIPKKNILPIAGKPLCAWVLEAIQRCSKISEIYVSTDCAEIKQTVTLLAPQVKIIDRPVEISEDDSSTEATMLHSLPFIAEENLITVQATSPLLCTEHLDEAIRQFEQHELDSLLSAVRLKRFFWNDDASPINYDPKNRPMRQGFAGTLTENGAFYITKKRLIRQERCRLGGKIGIYEMPEDTFLELDEPSDWVKIETLLLDKSNEN